jgi:nitrate reductase gamma subunit
MRYFGGSLAATSMLWLSGFALVWTLLSPSVFSGERMNDARRRILRSMFSDPLVWVMMLLVLVSGVRALNGGIKMAYDAELRAKIVAVMAEGVSYTPSDLVKLVDNAEIPNTQKITPMLTALVTDGVLTKATVKGRSVYSLSAVSADEGEVEE